MFIVYVATIVLTATAAVLTTLQTLLTVLFRRRVRFFEARPQPRAATHPSFPRAASSPRARSISILKPVCGLDDDLENNVESFARLRGIDYEIVLSVADPDDPALPILRRVIGRNPQVAWKLVVGGNPALEAGNRKVARLIAAASHASGGILMISDSNVRVLPDDVSETLQSLADPGVGCVSNLFTGADAASFGASIESLHLLGFVVSGTVLAAAAGVPCVVGKSMAITREALAAIGGFEAFSRVLAEDQAIGLAVQRAGYRVVLSPVVVRNVVVRRTLRRALDRQVRWNKIRYAFSRATYTTEFLLNPLAFAILAVPAAAAAGIDPLRVVPVAAGAAVLRILQMSLLARATDAPLRFRELLLTPVLDILMFAAQFVPYVDDRVTWRGYSARIGAQTVLVDVVTEEPAVA